MYENNKKHKLTPAVIAWLPIGATIYTNGDGSIAASSFIAGTLMSKNECSLLISRRDHERGSGPNNEWVVRYAAGSEIVVYVHVPAVPTTSSVDSLTFGSVIHTTEGNFIFLAMARNQLVCTLPPYREYQLFPTNDSATVEVSGKEPFMMCSHPRCKNEATSAVVLPGVRLYCDEHAPEDVSFCERCHLSIPTSALTQVSVRRGLSLRVCAACVVLERQRTQSIQSHSFKPRPQFIRVTPATDDLRTRLYMGAECEVECPEVLGATVYNFIPRVTRQTERINIRPSTLTRNAAAQASEATSFAGALQRIRREVGSVATHISHKQRLAKVLVNRFNRPIKWFYLKDDGSIGCGFELVTEPATLEAHKVKLPWEKTFKFMNSQGFEADRTTSCGLHVHVNKRDMPEDHRIRLGYFVNNQKGHMEALARRQQSDYARFKPRNQTSIEEYGRNTLGGKYEALNWGPPETVEFRLFRGTINHEYLLASFELVEALILYTATKSIEDIKKKRLAWTAFVQFIMQHEYQFLPKYMSDRGVI